MKYIDELYVKEKPLDGSYPGYIESGSVRKYLAFKENPNAICTPAILFFDSKVNDQLVAISSYLNLSNSDSDFEDIYNFYFLPLEEKAAHIKKHLDSVYRRADKILKV